MEKPQLTISEEEARKLYKDASDEFRATLLETFGKKFLETIKYPTTLNDLHGDKSRFFISNACNASHAFNKRGQVSEYNRDLLSSEKRVDAFVALMQLIEYRDAWNEVDGFVLDYGKSARMKYVIHIIDGQILCHDVFTSYHCILTFGSQKTRTLFYETFIDLIYKAKELL